MEVFVLKSLERLRSESSRRDTEFRDAADLVIRKYKMIILPYHVHRVQLFFGTTGVRSSFVIQFNLWYIYFLYIILSSILYSIGTIQENAAKPNRPP